MDALWTLCVCSCVSWPRGMWHCAPTRDYKVTKCATDSGVEWDSLLVWQEMWELKLHCLLMFVCAFHSVHTYTHVYMPETAMMFCTKTNPLIPYNPSPMSCPSSHCLATGGYSEGFCWLILSYRPANGGLFCKWPLPGIFSPLSQQKERGRGQWGSKRTLWESGTCSVL